MFNCLRTVPTFVTVHTFWASRDTRVSYGRCILIQGYFCEVRRKQNLAIALGIQKENWGNHAFFRDNLCSVWEKVPYIALYFTVF